MWRIKVLTEQFGSCGQGWYYVPVKKWVETAGQVLLYFALLHVCNRSKEHHFVEIEETYLDEDGNEKVRAVPKMIEDEIEVEVDSYVLNPDYDPDRLYTPRAERKEWAAVGMLGVLLVRDDGTCQVNSYCKVADGGIATANKTGWRVIARVNEHLVKIVYR